VDFEQQRRAMTVTTRQELIRPRDPGKRGHRCGGNIATERMEWTAWAAVVELALRRMVTDWCDLLPNEQPPDFEWISAAESPHAAISFAQAGHKQRPLALCIRLAGFEKPGRAPRLNGVFRRVTTWELREQDVPWRTEEGGRCPSATTLWSCALGKPGPRMQTAYYLGASDDRG
jgi:hypothetical protein